MDGEQNAVGLVHFSPQIPLECTCTTDLWPKLFETSLFLREYGGAIEDPLHQGLSFGLQNPPSGALFLTKQ